MVRVRLNEFVVSSKAKEKNTVAARQWLFNIGLLSDVIASYRTELANQPMRLATFESLVEDGVIAAMIPFDGPEKLPHELNLTNQQISNLATITQKSRSSVNSSTGTDKYVHISLQEFYREAIRSPNEDDVPEKTVAKLYCDYRGSWKGRNVTFAFEANWWADKKEAALVEFLNEIAAALAAEDLARNGAKDPVIPEEKKVFTTEIAVISWQTYSKNPPKANVDFDKLKELLEDDPEVEKAFDLWEKGKISTYDFWEFMKKKLLGTPGLRNDERECSGSAEHIKKDCGWKLSTFEKNTEAESKCRKTTAPRKK